MKETQDPIMAFPCAENGNVFSDGMELRDWFAGKALSSLFESGLRNNEDAEDIAEACYLVADAMMKERAKKESKPVDKD